MSFHGRSHSGSHRHPNAYPGRGQSGHYNTYDNTIGNAYSPPPGGNRYGHQPSGNYYPPQNSDPQLWEWFSAVDRDRSGSISVTELQAALVNGNFTNFDLDTVKMLMNIFDTDRSGTIGFREFEGLWKYIYDWQQIFVAADKDRSGFIDRGELSAALSKFGYSLSPTLVTLIQDKYCYDRPAGIPFDRFVRACVVIKTLTEAFQQVDTDRDGWVQVNYEQFMTIVLRAP